LAEYDKQARQCAEQGIDHPRYLLRLVGLELIERQRKMVERRLVWPRSGKHRGASGRQSSRPPKASLSAMLRIACRAMDSFDFKALPDLNKVLVLELARAEFIIRRENIIALGPSGTGKTHLAIGLGLAACQKGMTVGFVTAAGLVNQLTEARTRECLP